MYLSLPIVFCIRICTVVIDIIELSLWYAAIANINGNKEKPSFTLVRMCVHIYIYIYIYIYI